MQDVTSFVKAQSPLSLSISGADSKKESASKGETKNLFSLLLAGLSATKAEIKLGTSSDDVKIAPPKEELKESKESPKKAKSVDEHLLGDLLKIVESLKTNSPLPLLPTLKSGSTLEKIINNQTALKEFTEVKSINDVLSLSKKYNLGLEKLTVTKESVETLQKEFPTLAKSSFFETLKQAVVEKTEAQPVLEKSIETPKSINPLEKNIKKSEVVETPSALKELMSKETRVVKAEEAVSKEIKTTETSTKTAETMVIQKTTTPLKEEAKEMKVEAKEVKVEANVVKETKTTDTSSKVTPQKTVETMVIQKTITPLKEEVKEIKTDKKTVIESIATQTSDKEIVETKPVLPTRANEPKVEAPSVQKGLAEAILQTIKSEKSPAQKPVLETDSAPMEGTSSQSTIPTELSTDKPVEITPLSNDTKLSIKQEIAPKQAIAPKESLNQFANDFKEKVEAYKPPIMKVELALFPKSLGEVDVTLLTRGNNLHVNISSNTTTMTLFTQNQAEFKNALVNMGFTNLEMNFSDQRGQERNNPHAKEQKNAFGEDVGELDETLSSIELVVPNYI
jgi:hypothetical protein